MDFHTDILVVGAGVAGLACAAALADAGCRVTVVEAGEAAGGRARSWHDAVADCEVDIGPHVVSTEHVNFLSLLERLGTAGDIHWQPDPLVTLFDARGRLDMVNSAAVPPLHGLPNLPRALTRLSWRDLLSHARVGWAGACLDEARLQPLDAEDMHAYLRRMGVAPPAIEWFWRSAILALLNVPLEHCSVAAGMRVFRLMQGRSGYHFGFPKVGLSQLYVPGCCAKIRQAGGTVLFGSSARALRLEQGALRGVRLADGRGPSVIASNAIGPLARSDWDDARIVAQTRAEIAQFAPAAATAQVRHARVHRIPMAIPQPRPGTEARRPGVRTDCEGLWLAGDWTDTAVPCSMESAARSGALAAEAVLERLGRPVRLAIEAPETRGLPGLVRRIAQWRRAPGTGRSAPRGRPSDVRP